MAKQKSACDNEVTHAMTQVVLNDILNSVIEEFESRTDSKVGRVTVHAKKEDDRKRVISAEITRTGEKCISGLVEYKKILCQQEPFVGLKACDDMIQRRSDNHLNKAI